MEAYDAQLPQPAQETKSIDEFLRTYDSPMLREAEEAILKYLKEARIEAPTNRERALVRALGWNHIILQFERTHAAIWASQLAMLRWANPRTEGISIQDATYFYEQAKAAFPAWYESYSYDRWCGFLVHFNLIQRRDDSIFITVAGREFLKYIIDTGKSDPRYG